LRVIWAKGWQLLLFRAALVPRRGAMARALLPLGKVDGASAPNPACQGEKRMSWITRAAPLIAATGVLGLALIAPAAAQEVAPAADAAAGVVEVAGGTSAETQFVFNTLSFLMCGFLVMWMAAGFAMLEAGLVRKRSVGTQLLKNISLYSTAGIMFYLVGYNLMYAGVDGGWFGSLGLWAADDSAALETGYASGSDWFFQMVFVATAASIVSGAVAERIRVWPFLLFVVILTGVLYPITGAWTWGGGWLAEMGFADFAGSTIVHSVGGWAALAGVILLGARKGKYGPDGRVNPMLCSSLPLATLGTFILWLGWFGFNGGSQLALGTLDDAIAISTIFINTNLAAAGGVLAAMILCELMYKKTDLTLVLNGAIAGLVSITAEPLAPAPGLAILIGAVGGAIIVFSVPLLDRLRVDDVVGAIPAHLFAGIWGTLAVVLSNPDASLVTQVIGIIAMGAFTLLASFAVFGAIKAVVGLRISGEAEDLGIDHTELGMEAYPEFGQSPAH
jgi:ammonium transporter, Amt family